MPLKGPFRLKWPMPVIEFCTTLLPRHQQQHLTGQHGPGEKAARQILGGSLSASKRWLQVIPPPFPPPFRGVFSKLSFAQFCSQDAQNGIGQVRMPPGKKLSDRFLIEGPGGSNSKNGPRKGPFQVFATLIAACNDAARRAHHTKQPTNTHTLDLFSLATVDPYW